MATFYRAAFSNATTVSIPGALHALGTSGLVYQVYDALGNAIEEASWHVDPVTYDIMLTFAVPQTGTVAVLAAVASGSDPVPGPVQPGHLEPELRAILVDDIVQYPYFGQDAYGKPQYGPAFRRPARIEYMTKVVSTTGGPQQSSTTTLFLDGDIQVHVRDKLVLPDGTAPTIQEIEAPRHPFRPATLHHYAVKL